VRRGCWRQSRIQLFRGPCGGVAGNLVWGVKCQFTWDITESEHTVHYLITFVGTRPFIILRVISPLFSTRDELRFLYLRYLEALGERIYWRPFVLPSPCTECWHPDILHHIIQKFVSTEIEFVTWASAFLLPFLFLFWLLLEKTVILEASKIGGRKLQPPPPVRLCLIRLWLQAGNRRNCFPCAVDDVTDRVGQNIESAFRRSSFQVDLRWPIALLSFRKSQALVCSYLSHHEPRPLIGVVRNPSPYCNVCWRLRWAKGVTHIAPQAAPASAAVLYVTDRADVTCSLYIGCRLSPHTRAFSLTVKQPHAQLWCAV